MFLPIQLFKVYLGTVAGVLLETGQLSPNAK